MKHTLLFSVLLLLATISLFSISSATPTGRKIPWKTDQTGAKYADSLKRTATDTLVFTPGFPLAGGGFSVSRKDSGIIKMIRLLRMCTDSTFAKPTAGDTLLSSPDSVSTATTRLFSFNAQPKAWKYYFVVEHDTNTSWGFNKAKHIHYGLDPSYYTQP